MESTFVIEIKLPDTKHWKPVGIYNTDNTPLTPRGRIKETCLITRIREQLPKLDRFEMQLRLFVIIPGVYLEGEEPGDVIIIKEKSCETS